MHLLALFSKKPSLPAKQLILGPLFYIFSKKICSLTSLGMNIIPLFHSSGLTLLIIYFIYISSSYVHTFTL